MPARVVKHQDGMSLRGDGSPLISTRWALMAWYLPEAHDQASTDAAIGAERTEEVGAGVAAVPWLDIFTSLATWPIGSGATV